MILVNWVNVFGNTDYNSYAVDIDLTKEEITSVKGEGSIIVTNEDPSIDIDILIQDLDISFIEKVGSNTMSNISSTISGEVNSGVNRIIFNTMVNYTNQSKFTILILMLNISCQKTQKLIYIIKILSLIMSIFKLNLIIYLHH